MYTDLSTFLKKHKITENSISAVKIKQIYKWQCTDIDIYTYIELLLFIYNSVEGVKHPTSHWVVWVTSQLHKEQMFPVYPVAGCLFTLYYST